MPGQQDRSLQSRLQRLVIALGLAAAFPATGADVVFYENDAFRGRSFVADQSISNFADVGFNDRASSVVIRSGTWQLCSDAFFRGRCVTLAPGEYPTLRSMSLENQISSARSLDWLGGGGGAVKPGGRVELFSGDRFEGRVFVVNGAVTNLPNDFNDRARSMVVYDGNWEVCEDIDYRGTCQTYGPGRYASLGGMANRVSSLRPGSSPGPGPGPGPARARRARRPFRRHPIRRPRLFHRRSAHQLSERLQRSRTIDDRLRRLLGSLRRRRLPRDMPDLRGRPLSRSWRDVVPRELDPSGRRSRPWPWPRRGRLGHRRAGDAVRRPQPVRAHLCPRCRGAAQPRPRGIQRSRLVAADRGRLLAVLQRHQLPTANV